MTDPTRHPRPSLRRPFELLDGAWELAVDSDERWTTPGSVAFDREITVPFAPECAASGVGITDRPVRRAWYRRTVDLGGVDPDRRHIAHFGAVDRRAWVWANGEVVGTHEGGYTPFEVDLTEAAARDGGRVELVVRADDDPRDLDAPRGKQEWLDAPHAVWYPRTTGIWRSVFTEARGPTHIAAVEAVGDPASMTLALRIRVEGRRPDGLVAHIRVSSESSGAVFVDDRVTVTSPEVVRTVTLGDGGIDDAWGLCWRPFFPHLLNVDVALVTSDGRQLDATQSDTALRSFSIEDNHFCVNGRPYPLRLVLDQGYWPGSGATPPSVDALRTDLELTRALGFNGVRKHQKTEDPRFFALADRMGLLSWVEMPSAYRASPVSAARLTREWAEVVAAHRCFASVAAWVPVNESWGVMGVAHDRRQRALVASLAQLTDALDGTRPVSANDGWETVGGDIVGIHDYDQRPDELRRLYGTHAAVEALLAGTRSDGNRADVDGAPLGRRAAMLTELGGTALAADTTEGGAALGVDGSSWGYDQVRTGDELVGRVRELWSAVHASEVLAGACWTQLTDVDQEVNGLLRFDRTPKAPVEDIAAAVKGR